MMPIGVFTGYFPHPMDEQIRRIKAQGFNTVQLDLAFKDIEFAAPEDVTKEKARRVRDAFRDADLPVCCVSGYTNLVHPDPDRRRANLDMLRAIIRHARDFGSPFVLTETGTFDPDSDWVHHPKNRTEEGWDDCRTVISDLTREAREHGAVLVLETYVNNVVGSIEETLRMFAEVDSPELGLVMDPTNYFEDHNIDEMDRTLRQIFDALDDHIKIAHAKDVKRSGEDKSEKHAAIDAVESHSFRGVGEIELPAPGLGVLDYEHYLARLARSHPNVPMIIEHLDEDDIPRAKAFIADKLKAVGV